MDWRIGTLVLVGVFGSGLPAQAARRAAVTSERSAFASIASESYGTSSGVCLVNGDVACADGGDFVRYQKINFGTAGAESLELLLAVRAENANQPIEIRIDDRNGTLIGNLNTTSTNGAYAKQSTKITKVVGVHDLFLVFPGSRPTGPIDNFRFIAASASAPVVTAPVVKPPVVTAPVVTAPVVTAPVVTAPTAPVVTAPPVVKPPVVTTPPVVAAPAPVVPAPANGRLIPPSWFGMHVEQQFNLGWPSVSFGIQRAWGIYPAIGWDAVSTGPGVYDWKNLDNWVADSSKHNVELVYVLAGTPAWASTNPTGECGGMPRGSCYPATGTAWVDFIKAVSERYQGKIKYFELWNEPDATDFWRGTPAQLATMAKQAYPIIAARGITVLSPSPQGKYGPTWMENYLKAGGTPYADVNAFHAYLYDAPEALTALVNSYRTLFAKYGIDKRPLWDTEHSWGEPDSPMGGDVDSQVAWLARFQVLSVQNKIDRSIWYGWEHDNWGTLFDKNTKKITKVGYAYGYVYNWLVNSTLGECAQSGTLYQCPLTRPGGTPALIAWATSGSTTVTVPAGFTKYETLDGTTVATTAGAKVSVGAKAILLRP